jgi:hypothetical protein
MDDDRDDVYWNIIDWHRSMDRLKGEICTISLHGAIRVWHVQKSEPTNKGPDDYRNKRLWTGSKKTRTVLRVKDVIWNLCSGIGIITSTNTQTNYFDQGLSERGRGRAFFTRSSIFICCVWGQAALGYNN